MKKLIAAALAICLLFALCSCGEEIEEPVARDCGLYITIEAKDVFVVACGTDAGSESCENADKTPFAPGSTVHFDFAGDAAEASEPCEIAYSVCIYDRNLNVIANESFTDDFSGLAKVKVTVTEDHSILREGEKPSFGGEVIVSFGSFALDHIQLTTEYPIVTMQCTPDVAEKINARIGELTDAFTGTLAQECSDDYTFYLDGLATDEEKEAAPEFIMQRLCRLIRCDTGVLSFVFTDTVCCGPAGSSTTVSAYSFDTVTGEQLSIADLSGDEAALRDGIAEDMLIASTEEERFTDGSMAFIDGYTNVIPELIADGGWYLSDDGIVIIANAGTIAPAENGAFEFSVAYEELDGFDEKLLPVQPEGETGSIMISLIDGIDLNAHSVVREAEGADAVISAVGDVYGITVTDTATGKLLVCCNRLLDGAALPVAAGLSPLSGGVTVSCADGYLKCVTLSVTGELKIDNPAVVSDGEIITSSLPFTGDLNGDGVDEEISLTTTEDEQPLYTLHVKSGENDFTRETKLASVSALRLYDLNGDGNTELYLEGKLGDGGARLYCCSFDGELRLVKLGSIESIRAKIRSFTDDKLVVRSSLSLLGTYDSFTSYRFTEAGDLDRITDEAPVRINANGRYLTLKAELNTTAGDTLAAGTQILLLSTDGESYVNFIDLDGNVGVLAIDKQPEAAWTVDGKNEYDCFETLPY